VGRAQRRHAAGVAPPGDVDPEQQGCREGGIELLDADGDVVVSAPARVRRALPGEAWQAHVRPVPAATRLVPSGGDVTAHGPSAVRD
jgi:hypothetical protein